MSARPDSGGVHDPRGPVPVQRAVRAAEPPPVELVNLTPHDVTITTPGGDVFMAACVNPARCERRDHLEGEIRVGPVVVPIYRVVFGAVTCLLPEQPGRLLVVSRLVAEARPDRRDLVVPDRLIRDDAGRPVGCRGLATIAGFPPAASGE